MRKQQMDIERDVEAFVKVCREAGLRVTPQRLAVFRELTRAEGHPSAEAVYRVVREDMPTISLDTVYRTLASLEERDIISRVGVFAGRARFEANRDPHHHFVCTKCGTIHDVAARDGGGGDWVGALPEGCTVRAVHVEIRGLCAACADGHSTPQRG